MGTHQRTILQAEKVQQPKSKEPLTVLQAKHKLDCTQTSCQPLTLDILANKTRIVFREIIQMWILCSYLLEGSLSMDDCRDYFEIEDPLLILWALNVLGDSLGFEVLVNKRTSTFFFKYKKI